MSLSDRSISRNFFMPLVLLALVIVGAQSARAQTPIPFVVRDLFVIPTSYSTYTPGPTIECAGRAYFAATSSVNGRELWSTDGTPAGTTLVRDIYPGVGSADPTSFIVYAGKLYFSATDGTHGREVWVTDGTAAGTRMLADFRAGTLPSDPTDFRVVDDKLVFSAWSTFYVYDGVTLSVLDFLGACCLQSGACVVLSRTNCAAQIGMWGGTEVPCQVVACTQPMPVSCCLTDKSCVYLAAGLCVTAGGTPNAPNTLCGACTDPATVVCCLPDNSCTTIAPQDCAAAGGSQRFFTTSCSPAPCAAAPIVCCLPSQQCFVVSNNTECTSRGGVLQLSSRVCSVPGTTQTYCSTSVLFPCCRMVGGCTVTSGAACLTTHKGWLRPANQTCAPTGCFAPVTGSAINVGSVWGVGSRVITISRTYSSSTSVQIWAADDLSGPRQLLATFSALASNPMECGGNLYFGVGSNSNYQLWVTDGTASGTHLVPGLGNAIWSGNVAAGDNGVLYFEAVDADGVGQLWRTDASPQGTYPLTAFPFGSSSIRDVVSLNGGVLFNRALGQLGSRQLWRLSDPPLPGEPVAISPPQLQLAESTSLAKLNSELFLCAGTGTGLWRTDGTASGTLPVPGPAAGARGNLTSALNRVFYTGAGAPPEYPSGADVLWSTDGTAVGTGVVAHIDGQNSSDLGQMCAASGDNLFFEAPGVGIGRELFITDGSQAGTRLVKDLVSGATGSVPRRMVYANNTLLFTATIPEAHDWDLDTAGVLCRSDGTPDGTGVIGSTDGIASGGSRAVEFTAYAGRLYYFDRSPESGYELWSTDGSLDGASIFFEAVPGPANGFSKIDEFPATAVHGGLLYFRARSGLYRTDGTAAGTTLVYASDPDQNSPIGKLYPTNIGMYFAASGRLWKTDGTAAGTQPLVPGNVPPYGGFDLIETNGRLYFIATTGGGPSYALWTSDGTAAGTIVVTPLALGSFNGSPSVNMVGYAGKAYFFLPGTPFPNAGTGPILTVSDGTAAGTHTVFDPVAFPYWVSTIKSFGNKLLLGSTVPNSSNGDLWSYDGVAPPSKLTSDEPAYTVRDLTIAGPYMYFLRYNWSTFEGLYRTDGTPQGTVRVTPHDVFLINSSLGFSGLGAFGSDVALAGIASGDKGRLYRTRAPAIGIEQVAELGYTGGLNSFTQVGPQLFFKAGTFLTGEQVFVTDGTTQGTRAATNVNRLLPAMQTDAVVGVTGGFHICSDASLLFTDGTTEGTRRVMTLPPTGSPEVISSGVACVNDALYFIGDSPSAGTELWRSDGTPNGAAMLADFTPGTGDSIVNRITQGVNRIFFSAGIPMPPVTNVGQEPCISDGTVQGTRVIVDLRPGTSGSSPQQFVDTGAFAVFTADVGGGAGRELYHTDGTAAGTFLLKDILPGSATSNPQGIVRVGPLVYFTADDGVHGRELWRTDGSVAGTMLVRDVCPGAIGANPQWLTAVGDRVYFTAYTPETGIELWTSNGSAAGTIRMFEIVPGPSSANIRNLTVAGGRLYFLATVPPQEASLWSFDWVGGSALLCVADYNRSSTVTIDDLFLFLNSYFTGVANADIDGSGDVSLDDLFTFFNRWFTGC